MSAKRLPPHIALARWIEAGASCPSTTREALRCYGENLFGVVKLVASLLYNNLVHLVGATYLGAALLLILPGLGWSEGASFNHIALRSMAAGALPYALLSLGLMHLARRHTAKNSKTS